MMRFFDDIRVGDKVAIGTHLFTAEEIKIFARQYDPQPFHVDETLAEHIAFRRARARPAGTPPRCGCARWSITASARPMRCGGAASRCR